MNKIVFAWVLILLFFIPWFRGGELLYEHFIPFSVTLVIMGLFIFSNLNDVTKSVISHKYLMMILLSTLLYIWSRVFIGLDGYLSSSPDYSTIANLRTTFYVLFFFLLLFILNSVAKVQAICNTIFITATISCIYSLINHYTSGQYELISAIPPWGAKWGEVIRGTFSYKNHYATYLATSALIGAGLCISIYQVKKTLIENLAAPLFLCSLLAMLLLLVTIMKTGSRGCILTLSVVIAIYLVRCLWRNRNNVSTKMVLSGCLIVCSASVVFTQSSTYERLKEYGVSPNGRDIMQETVFKIVKSNYLLFGTGPDTYPIFQHQYKNPSLGSSAMSKKAHNDYLELLSNHGLVGLSLFMWFCVAVAKRAFVPTAMNSKKVKYLSLGLKLALVYLLIHSALDFNFALPSIALLSISCIAGLIKLNDIGSTSFQKISTSVTKKETAS